MTSLPSRAQRHNGIPIGLYRRYEVKKAGPENDGPDDPKAVHIVLRVDAHGNDKDYLRACQRTVLRLAELLPSHHHVFADDLRRLIAKCAAELEMREVMESVYSPDNK